MARRRNKDGLIILVLLPGWGRWLARQSPAPVPEPTQQALRAERLADAVLDGLHMREHEDAGVVHQWLGHVERTRQHPGRQIERPRNDVGGGEGSGSGAHGHLLCWRRWPGP